MAASTSREPHDIPLPPSPSSEQGIKAPAARKGKARDPVAPGHTKRRVLHKSATKFAPRTTVDAGLDWEWTALTDSYISRAPPIFTKDGSYFFSLVGPSVKIYSVVTGQIVSTLSAPRVANSIVASNFLTCAVLNPHNAFQLITGSLNGRIHIWDFLEASLLKTIDLSHPIQHVCAHAKYKDYVFVAMMRASKDTSKKNDNAVVLKISLQTRPSAANSNGASEATVIGKTKFPTGLSISANGTWIVATSGHKSYVASLASHKPKFTKYVSPDRITCLALHPSEDYFATGDVKGIIRLWYCLNDQTHVESHGVEKRTQTASLHWHAHAVSSLSFSSNGAYLLSGGEESVLVVWQLQTGKKEFVPRLGAPINAISVLKASHEEAYLVGLADGVYLFINSGTLQTTKSISRIRLDPVALHSAPSTSKNASAILASHPTTSTLILPSSHPSSLQIFSLSTSRVISELEVVPSNRVSRRDDKAAEPPCIELTTIAPSGDWMATVDRREGDGVIHSEVYLKIWHWDRETAAWTLNTRIDRPHGVEQVTSVSFSPTSSNSPCLLVSTGGDGNVKIWRMKGTKARGEFDYWVARATFAFRSQTPKQASWSPDASLLAVSFNKHVVLYDPVTTTPQSILATPESPEVSLCHFVGATGRFLVVQAGRVISLWDLVLQTVSWHRRMEFGIEKVIPHPTEDTFTLISRASDKTRASLFSCTSSQPKQTRSLPFTLRSVVPHSTQFVGISHDWNLVVFGDGVQQGTAEGSTARSIHASAVSTKATLFQDIFGKSAFTPRTEAALPVDVLGTSTVHSLFDGPTYMMPPLESLFDDAIGQFVQMRDGDAVPAVDEDGDIDMDGVDEQPQSTIRLRAPDDEDMDVFVNLFKQHSIQPKRRPPVRSKPATNGTSKVNGHGHDRKRIGKPPVPSTPTSLPSSPVTMANGKKRKKVD